MVLPDSLGPGNHFAHVLISPSGGFVHVLRVPALLDHLLDPWLRFCESVWNASMHANATAMVLAYSLGPRDHFAHVLISPSGCFVHNLCFVSARAFGMRVRVRMRKRRC